MQITVALITTGSVTITVTGGPGNIRDYVGLYLPGAANYFDWRYVANGLKGIKAVKGSTSGVVKFLNLKVGAYEAKLFSLTDAGVATLIEAMPFGVGGVPVIVGNIIVGPDSSAVVGPDTSAVVGP